MSSMIRLKKIIFSSIPDNIQKALYALENFPRSRTNAERVYNEVKRELERQRCWIPFFPFKGFLHYESDMERVVIMHKRSMKEDVTNVMCIDTLASTGKHYAVLRRAGHQLKVETSKNPLATIFYDPISFWRQSRERSPVYFALTLCPDVRDLDATPVEPKYYAL